MAGMYNFSKVIAVGFEHRALFGLISNAFVGAEIFGGHGIRPLLDGKGSCLGIPDRDLTILLFNKCGSSIGFEVIRDNVVPTFGKFQCLVGSGQDVVSAVVVNVGTLTEASSNALVVVRTSSTKPMARSTNETVRSVVAYLDPVAMRSYMSNSVLLMNSQYVGEL